MATEQIERTANNNGAVLPTEGARYTPTGLVLDPNITFDRWVEIGHFIGGIHRASSWFLGDWILEGERLWGEMYAQAVNDLGLDYKTCVNTVYVCKHVPPTRRRADASFSHHAEVAPLDPDKQVSYLALAVEQKWTKAELREAIKNGGVLPPRPQQPGSTDLRGALSEVEQAAVEAGTLRPRNGHAEAQAQSPGQTIPGVTHPRGEVLTPPSASNAVLPDSVDEVYEAAAKIAPAAIEVVRSRGKKGIKDLRAALVAAGYEI